MDIMKSTVIKWGNFLKNIYSNLLWIHADKRK